MQNENHPHIFAFPDWQNDPMPERALLGAIFDRAYRDLGFTVCSSRKDPDKELLQTTYYDRLSAYEWFTARPVPDQDDFTKHNVTFIIVREELSFTVRQMEFLKAKLLKAEVLLAEEKAKLERVRISFVKKQPVPFRKEKGQLAA